MGVLEGCTDLPALQPLYIPLGLVWMQRGLGALYVSIPGLQGVVLLGVIRLSHCPTTHQRPLNL